MVSTSTHERGIKTPLLHDIWPELLSCGILTLLWMWQLQVLPAWYDEAITLAQLGGSPQPTWPQGLLTVADHRMVFEGRLPLSEIAPMLRETDVHPPLYYWAARLWSDLAGQGLISVRGMSLVAVLVAMAAVGVAATSWGAQGRRLALLAFAVAPMATWSVVSARDYGVALCMVALALAAATRVMASDRMQPWAIIIFGLAAGLAFLTHYFTLLATAPAGLVLILTRGRQAPLAIAMGVLVFTGVVAVAVSFLQAQLGARPDQMSEFEGILPELRTLIRLQLTLLVEIQPSGLLRPVSFALSAALMIAVGLSALLQVRRDPRVLPSLAAFAGYWLGLLVLFWLTDKSIAKGAAARYAAFALPSFCLLIAAASVYWREWMDRTVPALFGALILALGVISWGDGHLGLYPWNNARQIAAIKDGLSGAEPETVTVLVPMGFGRGGPGRFALALDPEMRMAVLDPARDFALVQSSGPDRGLLAGAKAILLADDETAALDAAFARLEAELATAGYQDQGNGVWRAP